MLRVVDQAPTRLRDFLQAVQYDELQRALRRDYFLTPFPMYKEWKAATAEMQDAQRLAYDLLLFAEPVDATAATALWGSQSVDDLVAAGIATRDSDGRLGAAGYSLISYEGFYFLVSLNASYPASASFDSPIYAGPDSFNLVRALPRDGTFGNVLELCAGSGLCSTLLAPRSRRVMGSELNEEAVAAAAFNAALNGVSDRVEIRAGSLYEPVGAERFDLIVANPPFLPVPANLNHPLAMCGNGGEDGFSVLGALLDGIADHLTPRGKALIYAEGLGRYDGVRDDAFIADRLRALAQHTDLDVTLRLLGRMQIKHLLRLKSISLARQGEGPLAEMHRWREMYEGYGATHSYNFVIELQPGSGTFVSDQERRHGGPEPFFAAGKGSYTTVYSR